MTDETEAICPACDAAAPELLGDLRDAHQFAGRKTATIVRGGKLYKCRNCQLKFRFPIETEARYSQLYDHGEASNWTGVIPRPDWDRIVEHLQSSEDAHLAVLDFGCNTGGLLERLPSRLSRFGVEINQAAAAIAESQHGATVWSTLDAIPPDRRFDAIVAVDVVEHVANPRRLIEDLAQRLTDNGELILTTGDADNDWWNRFGANWWYCFHPEHIAFISEAWLQGLDRDSGLAVAQIERFRYRQLGPLTRIVHGMLMVLFGLLPSVYLGLRNAGRRLVSGPDVASVLGNGVSADHLFVVLRKKSHGQ